MKKLIFIFLILAGCNSIDPEPTRFNLEGVSIAGGQTHSVADSVSLFISTRALEESNKWKMVWGVDGQEIHSLDLSGRSGDIMTFKRFKGDQVGDYTFTGCIVSGNIRVCDDILFSLR